jgi:hypothetical protein
MASKIKVDQIEGSTGSSITIPTGQTLTITDGIAASTIGSGTLSSDRLPTVPVSKGGTGLSSLGTANQVVAVNSGATALEFQTASSGTVKQMITARDTTAYSVSVAGGNTNVTAVSILGTITPSATSSKIIVHWTIPQIDGDTDGPSGTFLRVYRKIGSGSYAELTEVNGVHGSGSGHNAYFSNYNMDGDANRALGSGFSGVFYDTTHNSTSALTYRMYIGCGDSGSYTYYVNRIKNGSSSASYQGSTATHATLMEI